MSRRQPTSRGVSWTKGAVAGVFAYVAGYLVVYLAKSDAINNYYGSGGTLGSPPEWKIGGWLFYAAHNVDVTVSGSGAGVSQSQTINFQDAPFWDGWLLLVPVAALLLAGIWMASSSNLRSQDGGVRAGIAVVPGYFVAAAGGMLLFTWTQTVDAGFASATASAHPEYVTGAVLAGIAYPLVVGAIGGAIGASMD